MMKRPTYRRLRQAGRHDRAFVEVDGRRIYLGRYGSDDSRQRYRQIVTEVAHTGRAPLEKDEVTVAELCDRYLVFARGYYREPDGAPSGECQNVGAVVRLLADDFDSILACEFGPKKLKALREVLTEKGNTRGYINQNIGHAKRMFKWAVRGRATFAFGL